MREFHLQIVTPDGAQLDGMAESLLVRSEMGDVEILAGHADLFASLGIGRARIRIGGKDRIGSAAGGFVSVANGEVKLIATTFEFADEIDLKRAKAAKESAEEKIKNATTDKEIALAKAKLARAVNRISVASSK
ncbi:MAG: ATP synthase F1 subunit epsilon [Clostridia bacterium]|nr:ATP synthase F1 subunit epsilon [Clostridia bacterium]